MNKEDRQQMYSDFLAEEGYRPHTTEGGMLSFKAEGLTFVVLLDEEDDQFFRVVVPYLWSIDGDDERRKVLAAVDDASGATKVAKVYTVEDNVWAAYESLFGDPEHFKKVFPRVLSTLESAVQRFVSNMRS